jgi:hypothetical protein
MYAYGITGLNSNTLYILDAKVTNKTQYSIASRNISKNENEPT